MSYFVSILTQDVLESVCIGDSEVLSKQCAAHTWRAVTAVSAFTITHLDLMVVASKSPALQALLQ